MKFDYNEAFNRNLGWVTSNEQQSIKKTRIAIVGMGGVGGHHLHCLIRIGFTKFKIADFDQFEIQNFNRQFGATISSLHKPKTDTIKKMAQDINPDVEIECFDEGVKLDNIDNFLEGVDIICDGLDLYASDLRSPLYQRAHQKGIYVVSSGPFGMGTSTIVFSPNKMSFNSYFDLNHKNLSVEAKIIRFLVGMSPSLIHKEYVSSAENVDLFGGRLPSIHSGCYAASAALSTAIVKIALKRGKVLYAPWTYQVDFYLNKTRKRYLPFGNRNIFQKFKIKMAHKMFEVKEFN